MTDIVERLRNRSPYLHGSSAERTMAEAAAEIERLKADAARDDEQMVRDSREIERLQAALKGCVLGSKDWMEKAKAALEPKPKPTEEPRDLTVVRVDEHGVAYNAAGESIGITGKTGHGCSGAVGKP